MDKKASVTSLMSAFVRAYHTEHAEKPILRDEYAKKLMSQDEYESVAGYIAGGISFFAPNKADSFDGKDEALRFAVNNFLAPTPLARAAYCEEALETAVKSGCLQYVILGAGLDTFAYRRPELMKLLEVFEVDKAETQSDKTKRIAEADLTIPPHLHFVPHDLSKPGLLSALERKGFDKNKKTFFGWLGVSYYLTEEAVEGMLDCLASFAADGSTLLFDCADEQLFSCDIRRVRVMTSMAEAAGEPMKFCCDEARLMSLLEKHSFLIYETLTPDETDEKYFRGRCDGLNAFEHIYYVQSVIKGTQFINTKEKIQSEALYLFSKDGYEAVSVKDIAERLSLTKGALYRHYASKLDIFRSIEQKMRTLDAGRASDFGMPADGGSACVASIREFCKSCFMYWTGEVFPCRFRRMLTIEQFRNAEMTELYKKYISSGPLSYMTEVLKPYYGDSAADEAARLYSGMFLYYSLYDSETDKQKITAEALRFIDRFCDGLEKLNEH